MNMIVELLDDLPDVDQLFKCVTCRQWFPASEFYKNATPNKRLCIDGMGRSSSCKTCGTYQNDLKNFLRVYNTDSGELLGIGNVKHPLHPQYIEIKNRILLSEKKSHRISNYIYEVFVSEHTNQSIDSIRDKIKRKVKGNQSMLSIMALNHMGIPEKDREVSIRGKSGKIYIADGIKGNTVIEIHGDYWHANPNLPEFRHGHMKHKTIKKTHQEIWDKDEAKRQDILDAGYGYQQYWESQLKGLSIFSKIKT